MDKFVTATHEKRRRPERLLPGYRSPINNLTGRLLIMSFMVSSINRSFDQPRRGCIIVETGENNSTSL